MSSGIEALVNREYAYGFVTDIETDTVPAGLNEDIIRLEFIAPSSSPSGLGVFKEQEALFFLVQR